MSQTPREIVTKCLKFEYPERMPRDIWILPWSVNNFPDAVREIKEHFPNDIGVPTIEGIYNSSKKIRGDQYAVGLYTDEWGCVFTSIQAGIIGEIRKPVIPDLSEWNSVTPPYDILPENLDTAREKVKKYCTKTDKFVKAPCCARPWERYQFLRGTENSLIDIMMDDNNAHNLLKAIHEFYLKELEFWISTDVDALMFMDDWGSQSQLLIPPSIWREWFKPLYKDYCDMAHSSEKFIFMHSDGHISEIYEDLIEIGVDALNSQLFCMDMNDLEKRAKGKITFWGEIDRQHVLTATDPEVARNAVRKVAKYLYNKSGGIIVQFELGPGANPEMAMAIMEEWENVQDLN